MPKEQFDAGDLADHYSSQGGPEFEPGEPSFGRFKPGDTLTIDQASYRIERINKEKGLYLRPEGDLSKDGEWWPFAMLKEKGLEP